MNGGTTGRHTAACHRHGIWDKAGRAGAMRVEKLLESLDFPCALLGAAALSESTPSEQTRLIIPAYFWTARERPTVGDTQRINNPLH